MRKPLLPLLYYRLVWVDNDGEKSYSKSIRVQARGVHPIQIFPNPTQEFLRVVRPSNDTEDVWTISVYNGFGQRIQHQLLAESVTKLKTGGLVSGVYVVELQDESRRCYRERILKN